FWWKTYRKSKLRIQAPAWSFRYSAAVFSIPIFARASVGLALAASAACAAIHPKTEEPATPQSFYGFTAEIPLARHQPRSAALQQAPAAANYADVRLLARAAHVGP